MLYIFLKQSGDEFGRVFGEVFHNTNMLETSLKYLYSTQLRKLPWCTYRKCCMCYRKIAMEELLLICVSEQLAW